MWKTITAFGLLFAFAVAVPAPKENVSEQKSLPRVTLPYGTYQATSYDAANDMYVWKNIRFAAPPLGKLRWAKPMPPAKMAEVQINSKGGTCPQVYSPLSMQSAYGQTMSYLAKNFDGESSMDVGILMGGGPQSEDCLFLDVFAPAKAVNGSHAKLPVINWLYGGGYNFGSKDGFYDGTPIIKASGGNVIYVAANYRLSTLGFLAGTIIEKDKTAVGNAGFYDQRAVFEWIRDNIALFGGDPNDVSAWGESAGAGSIMHHLTAFGGKRDPLFRKAVFQSPSFNPQYDRNGALQKVYDEFAAFAGCTGKGLECLRALDIHVLQKAQQDYSNTVPLGTMGLGPSVDGEWVRQLAVLELATGNTFQGIDSMIVSHVLQETEAFVPDNPKDDGVFKDHVEWNYNNLNKPNHSVIVDAILRKMPSPGASLAGQNARFARYLDHKFNCNTRWLSEAYAGKTWNMQYSLGTGTHGEDVLAAFFSADSALASVARVVDPAMTEMAAVYQAYLLSHARTGDPNKLTKGFQWPKVKMGPEFGDVLEVVKPLRLVTDKTNTANVCDFWRDVLAGVTSIDGYAAPGAVLNSSIVGPVSNPSASFVQQKNS